MKLVSKIRFTYIILIIIILILFFWSLLFIQPSFYISLVCSIVLLCVVIYKISINNKIYRTYNDLLNKMKEIKEANYSGLIQKDSEVELVRVVDEFNDMLKEISLLKGQMKEQVKEETIQIKSQQKEIEEKNIILEDTKIGMLNLLEDIEDDKQSLKKERDKMRTILESIGDAVFVIDRDRKIVVYNQAAEQMVGVSTKRAIGKRYDKIIKFVDEKTNKTSNDFIESVMNQNKIIKLDSNTVLLRNNGDKIPVADSAAPILDNLGKLVGCVVVFRDITQERAVDRAKTEFVSLASHQLRTPLTAIKWYSSAVLSESAGKLPAKQKEYIEQVYNGNQRLIELVNSLLNVSRLELGTFYVKPELVSLKETILHLLGSFKVLIKEKELNLKVDIQPGLPKLMFDPILIMIIIQNLMSNAVKYTNEKGKINLSVKKEKNRIVIRVADSGVGIPKEQQRQIYTKLFRADNIRKMDTTGTGLGLYIVKTIVDLTGGEVSFASEENKGTTFIISYPLSGMKKRKGEKSLSMVKESI
jgi:PAS domain S-box-containing protein